MARNVKFKLECCQGSPSSTGCDCHRDLCPHYKKARQRVQQGWPYVGTGFGNLYGNPNHGHFLTAVREDFAKKSEPRESGKSGF